MQAFFLSGSWGTGGALAGSKYAKTTLHLPPNNNQFHPLIRVVTDCPIQHILYRFTLHALGNHLPDLDSVSRIVTGLPEEIASAGLTVTIP